MVNFKKIFGPASLAAIVALSSARIHAQLILSDNYNVSPNSTGFALNTGVNAGINPPTTRLTGSAAANLRYISTANPSKTNTAFAINSNKLRVTSAANPGRFTFSADGTTPFNFASALGTGT